jgi:hypothetical protein
VTTRDSELKARAIKAFDDHEIRDRTSRGYLVQQRRKDGGWTFDMAAEVFVGFMNYIYVGGDIDGLIFGHGPNDPRERIAWIGGCNDVSYYIHQKASIGTRSAKTVATIWDPAIAAACVRDRLHEETDDELREAVEEVLSHELESFDMMYNDLSNAIPAQYHSFLDDFWDVGYVVAPRVYYCWAAVRRLHLLLLEEEKGDDDGRLEGTVSRRDGVS